MRFTQTRSMFDFEFMDRFMEEEFYLLAGPVYDPDNDCTLAAGCNDEEVFGIRIIMKDDVRYLWE